MANVYVQKIWPDTLMKYDRNALFGLRKMLNHLGQVMAMMKPSSDQYKNTSMALIFRGKVVQRCSIDKKLIVRGRAKTKAEYELSKAF
ncbi:hypothetical protein KZW89_06145 [Escherichia coli O141:H4]|uniref:Uncharacterized protein n=1 Tax=Escherichia coli O141:H4 TaxID=2861806 RepID=A0ABD7FJN7_ECOLX|nr:hypothetical protein [Escherichia coli]QYE40597.1 hypothetical protein KZW89_06145 [Escherichia coli O141:H4]